MISGNIVRSIWVLILLITPALALDNQVTDPNQERTSVAFNLDLVEKLRDARSLVDVQHLAGSGGKIVSRSTTSPRVLRLHWISDKPDGHDRSMYVGAYEDGNFGLYIDSAGVGPVIINTYGAFHCHGCAPPVDICGSRPSWVGEAEQYCN